MSDKNTTVITPETNNNAERTFTQAEMDAIIGDRLARERAKYADYEDVKAKASKYDEEQEASKTELQKATERADALQKQIDVMTKEKDIQKIRDKVASEMKVPASLLTGDTEEACKTQAQGILDFAKPQGGSTIRDGGEVTPPGGKKDTRTLFAESFNELFK